MGWVVLQNTPPYAFNQSEMKKNNPKNQKKKLWKVDMPTLP